MWRSCVPLKDEETSVSMSEPEGIDFDPVSDKPTSRDVADPHPSPSVLQPSEMIVDY
jgi:hypothetical protein